MKRHRSTTFKLSIFVFGILLFATVRQGRAQSDSAALLRQAWENTERAGAYSFETQMTETVLPAPRLSSVGRTAKVESLYIEGTADRRNQQLDLTVWDEPASVYQNRQAFEMQIDGLHAQGRVHGGAWQVMDDFSSNFAPAGDAAAFLAAATNVRSLGSETRTVPTADGERSVTFERFTFTLDGDKYANDMRLMLQTQLQETGDLPPGVTLGTNEIYRQIVTTGEAWIDGNGLPVRLKLDMEHPQERSGERTFVEIQTDFIEYRDREAVIRTGIASNPVRWLGQQLQAIGSSVDLATLGSSTALFALVGIAAYGAWIRPKSAQKVLAGSLSLQMAFAPLAAFIDSHNMSQLYERFPSMAHVETDPAETAFAQLAELRNSIPQWDNLVPPLTAGQERHAKEEAAKRVVASTTGINALDGLDTDEDGLPDALEVFGIWYTSPTDPDTDDDGVADGAEVILCPDLSRYGAGNNRNDPACPDPEFPDSDNDGLTDGEEINWLGTYANDIDSDGDGIDDFVEVHGFVLGGVRYYTDPRNPDSDGDGRLDGAECVNMAAADKDNWNDILTCSETVVINGETIADVFAYDDDGDGVPTPLDFSPDSKVDTVFNYGNPLDLRLDNLTVGEPVLVDLQIRPTDEAQLNFAMNVLDWPTGDNEGQVQRFVDDTFGDLNPLTPLDDPSFNGDMRVSPMLEASLPGNTRDLPRRTARRTIDVTDAGQVVSVVAFERNEAEGQPVQVTMRIDELSSTSATFTVLDGSCTTGSQVVNVNLSEGNGYGVGAGLALGDVANGGHSIRVESDGVTYCEPIPSVIEGADKVVVRHQKLGSSLGTVTLVQTGGDTRFDFAGFAGAYDATVYEDDCRTQDNPIVGAAWSGVTGGESHTLAGRSAVSIADGDSSIVFAQSGRTVACMPIGNIINGSRTGMVDTELLADYQISVFEETDGTLTVMAPLGLQTDQLTGERVALNGRFYVEKAVAGLFSAEVRLNWIVTLLTDSCPDGDCSKGAINQSQIVHRYRDESWVITGLNVTEERSVKASLIVEDPDNDFDADGNTEANRHLQFDDNLWHMANGLSRSFLTGRDQDGNNVRDIRIDDIKTRWDSGSTFSDIQRWGIAADALNVYEYAYDSSAELGDIAKNQLPAVLSAEFGNGILNQPDLFNNETTSVIPTVLIANETESRFLGLDTAIDPSSSAVTISGSQITLNLDPAEITPIVRTAISWKPYRYNPVEMSWDTFPITEYWDYFASILATADYFSIENATDQDARYEAAANVRMAQTAYLNFYRGQGSTVEFNNTIFANQTHLGNDSDEKLHDESQFSSSASIAKSGLVSAYLESMYEVLEFEYKLHKRLKNQRPTRLASELDFSVKGAIGRSIQNANTKVGEDFLFQNRNYVRSKTLGRINTGSAIGSTAGTMLTGIAKGHFDASSDNTATRAVAITLAGIETASGVLENVQLAVQAIDYNITNSGMKGFSSTLKASKFAKVMAVAGFVLEQAISFGAFVYSMASAGVEAFSLAFNAALSRVIATAIVSALLTALASTGIGAIIVAIIGLIDGLIALFCAIFPPDDESEDVGDVIATWVCKGITGLMAEIVAVLIYDQTDLVTVSDPDRLQFSSFNPYLANPINGFTPGNTVGVELGLKNRLEVADISIGLGATYPWQYSEENLRESSFQYQLTDVYVTKEDDQIHNQVEPEEHESEWAADGDGFAINRNLDDNNVTTLPSAGINQPLSAYLAEGYSIPVQECFLLPPLFPVPPPGVPVCHVTSREESRYLNLGIVFDVFPTTLSDFYALTDKDGGKALAWGQAGELTFPRLVDADGDGLTWATDPDDSRRDTDGDTVTDLFELANGTDPGLRDTDGDGLDDNVELRYGSDPRFADTDSDGLQDGGERAGWLITYNFDGDETRVWSDPNSADADFDTIYDRREQALGFNPWVFNDPDVLAFDTDLRELDAPVLLLRLDERGDASSFADSATEGSALTAYCSDNHCPVSGVLGQIGNGAYFNGSSDYMTLGYVPQLSQLTNDFTVSAWVQPDATGGYKRIIGASRYHNEDGWAFGTHNGRLNLVFYNFKNFESTGTIAAGEWAHIAAVAEQNGGSTTVSFYINGQLAGTDSTNRAGANPVQYDEFMVGAIYQKNYYSSGERPDEEAFNANSFWNGRIDEIVVHGKVMSPGDINRLMDARYNPMDGIVTRNQTLEYETTVRNKLFGRSVEGLLHTEVPSVLSGVTEYENFTLAPHTNDGLARNELNQTADLTVSNWANTGQYTITQQVGAIIDIPPKPVPNTSQYLAFHQEEVAVFEDGDDHKAYQGNGSNRDYALDSSDFTIGLWVNPTSLSGERGLLGWNSGDEEDGLNIDRYPSLKLVDNGKISFGYGSNNDEWIERKSVNGTVALNKWTHVAVSYNRAGNSALLYINGVATDSWSFPAGQRVEQTGQYFAVGRSTNIGRIEFSDLQVRCEEDNDGPQFDLVYRDQAGNRGNIWSQQFIDEVEDVSSDSFPDPSDRYEAHADPFIDNPGGVTRYEESITVTMCENDYDEGDHSTCDGADDYMGNLWFPTWKPSESGNKTFSTTPNDSTCAWDEGYDDWVTVDYDYTVDSNPFQGSIKDIQIFTDNLSGIEITDLLQSNTTIAHFKMDDRPGSTQFNDDIAAAVGACSGGASCPVTGVLGRENAAAYFDGVDDYFSADSVSTLANTAANTVNRGLSFGAWVKPDAGVVATDFVAAFNTVDGGNVMMLGVRPGSDSNRFRATLFVHGAHQETVNDFSTGVWHHLFVTIDYTQATNNANLYVDGELQKTFTVTAKPTSNGQFTVGMEYDGSVKSDFFAGSIDEVFVAKSALPADDPLLLSVDTVRKSVPEMMYNLDDGDRFISVAGVRLGQAPEECFDLLLNGAEFDSFCTYQLPIQGDVFEIRIPIPEGPGELELYVTTLGPFGGPLETAFIDSATFNTSQGLDQVHSARFTNVIDGDTYDFFIDYVMTNGSDDTLPKPTEGQIYGAFDFDGVDDRITVPHGADQVEDITVTAWVNPDTITNLAGDGWQPIFASRPNEFWFLGLKQGKPMISLGTELFEAPRAIPPGQWTHLAYRRTSDGSGNHILTIFVNGSKVANVVRPADFVIYYELMYIGAGWRGWSQGNDPFVYFDGKIDEVGMYDKSLSDEEIINLYNYQATWLDEQQESPFTVDASNPRAEVAGLPLYMPMLPFTALIETSDNGSMVQAAQLGVDDLIGGLPDETIAAPACEDALPGTAYCATYTPHVEGVYNLYGWAIDSVGNQGGYHNTEQVWFDGTVPNGTVDTLPATPFRPDPVAGEETVWSIGLSGSASDPDILNTTLDGSGVESVLVELFDANDAPVGEPAQQFATVNGTAWSLDYRVRAENPTGDYTGRVTLVDGVGNTSVVMIPAFALDATDPAVHVDSFGASMVEFGGEQVPVVLGANVLLQGTVDEVPTSAETHTPAGVNMVQIAVEAIYPHGSPFVTNTVPANAVLYLPLDRSSATASRADDSFTDLATGATATCSGVKCPATGIDSRNGQGVFLDGEDDFLALPHDASYSSLVNDFTVAAWIKPTGDNFYQSIVSSDTANSNNGFSFSTSGNRLRVIKWGIGDAGTSTDVLRPNVWQHVAVYVTPANQYEFYVNGVLLETVNGGGAISADTDDRLHIGQGFDNPSDPNYAPFSGAIDEVVIATGRLSSAEWETVFGAAPTVHLTFDHPSIQDGDYLADEGKMGVTSRYINFNGQFNDFDRALRGHVGTNSLWFGENSSAGGVTVEAPQGVLPHGDGSYSISAWVYGNDGDPVLRYGSNLIIFGSDSHYFNGTSYPIADGVAFEWNHHLFVWDADNNALNHYLNGELATTANIASGDTGLPDVLTSMFWEYSGFFGTGYYFLDDLRVYKRAISAEEAAELNDTSWQDATVNVSRDVSSVSSWSATLPDNLEGYYNLYARGIDVVDNVDEEPMPAFSGVIDTMTPRGSMNSQFLAGSWFYSFTAQDFNLDETTLNIPAACDANPYTEREYYEAPWHRSLDEQAGQPIVKLNRIEVVCETSAQLDMDETFQICDVAGNCLIIDVTGTVVPTAVTLRNGSATAILPLLLVFGIGLGGVSLLLLRRRQQGE